MKINLNSRVPVYLQVVAYFKQEIASNILEPGQAIPSRRELASKLKINPNTAQRAYKEMEAEGLIETDRNVASTITRDAAVLKGVRQELIADAVSQFMKSVKAIDVPLDEVIQLIEEKYEDARRDDHD